jgi:small GTP-binding protein
MDSGKKGDNSNMKQMKQMKLMILGDQAVGKSSLLLRYTEDTFSLNMMGTAGIDLKKKIVTIDNELVKVMIYDTAGHDRFRQITKVQYKGSKGIILVYDVADRKSFESVSSWMDHINENADDGVEIMLVGNKIDMMEKREVTKEEGIYLAQKFEVPIVETSALSGENVEQAFLTIIQTVYAREKLLENERIRKLTLEDKLRADELEKKKKKNKCCF